MSTLSGIMNLQRQMQWMGSEADERKARQATERRGEQVREAMTLTQGDPAAMVREVSTVDPAAGMALRLQVAEERRRTEDQAAQVKDRKEHEYADMVNRVVQHKAIYSKGVQAVSEIQASPDPAEAYLRLRPSLMDEAGKIDPRLAEQFPEQYDAPTVKGILEFAKIGEAKTAKMQAGLSQMIPGGDKVKGLAEVFETVDTDEEREQLAERAAYFEMPDEQIVQAKRLYKKTAAAAAKALLPTAGSKGDLYESYRAEFLPNLPSGRSLSATQKAAAEKWWKTQTDVPTASDAAIDPAAIQAILKTPALFNRVNPEARWKLLAPLQRAGFAFPAGASELSPGELERLKVTDLRALAREARQPHPFLPNQSAMTAEEVVARRAEIEDFYRELGGTPAPPARAPSASASVPMTAPDGRRMMVPAGRVDEMLRLGATRE